MTYEFENCQTCWIFKPPRTAHCDVCNNCVERFDHHSFWLGTCIGKRNYRIYFSFISHLALMALHLILLQICAPIVVYRVGSRTGTTEMTSKAVAAQCVDSIFIALYCLVICYVAIPLTYAHTRRICSNETTQEQMSNSWSFYIKAPFSYGSVWQNWKSLYLWPKNLGSPRLTWLLFL